MRLAVKRLVIPAGTFQDIEVEPGTDEIRITCTGLGTGDFTPILDADNTDHNSEQLLNNSLVWKISDVDGMRCAASGGQIIAQVSQYKQL